jgi:hypothetical protein
MCRLQDKYSVDDVGCWLLRSAVDAEQSIDVRRDDRLFRTTVRVDRRCAIGRI